MDDKTMNVLQSKRSSSSKGGHNAISLQVNSKQYNKIQIATVVAIEAIRITHQLTVPR